MKFGVDFTSLADFEPSYSATRAERALAPCVTHETEAFEKLLSIMRGELKGTLMYDGVPYEVGPTIKEVLQACTTILAYQYGKPRQAVTVALDGPPRVPPVDLSRLTDEELLTWQRLITKTKPPGESVVDGVRGSDREGAAPALPVPIRPGRMGNR